MHGCNTTYHITPDDVRAWVPSDVYCGETIFDVNRDYYYFAPQYEPASYEDAADPKAAMCIVGTVGCYAYNAYDSSSGGSNLFCPCLVDAPPPPPPPLPPAKLPAVRDPHA